MRYRIRHRTSYRYERAGLRELQRGAAAAARLRDADAARLRPRDRAARDRDRVPRLLRQRGARLRRALPARAARDRGDERRRDPRGRGRADRRPGRRRGRRVAAARDARATTRRSPTSSPSSSARAPTSCSRTTRPRSPSALLAEDPDDERARASSTAPSTTCARRLEYRVGATTVNSSVAEVLAGGSGVCQDFAHVLISLCRHVGLPARYVSGYLGGVESSTASHAWAEAYVPPYGWVGVDATLGTPLHRAAREASASGATTPTSPCCAAPTRAAGRRRSTCR